MKNKFSYLIALLLCIAPFITPSHIFAESLNDYLDTLSGRLQVDIDILIDVDKSFSNSDFETGFTTLIQSRNQFDISNDTYNLGLNYQSDEDYNQVSSIIDNAIQGSQRVLDGIDIIIAAQNNSNITEDEAIDELTEALGLFENAYELYGSVVTDIDNLVQDYNVWMYVYGAFLVVGLIGLLVAHLLLKKQDTQTAEGRGKTFIYTRMRTGLLWFAGGFLITFATYLLLPGSTYYIMYGPVLYGAFEVMRSLFEFLKVKGNWELHYPSDYLNHDKVNLSQSMPQKPINQ